VRRRKTNLGAIIGGADGGGVALIVILLIGFCCICRRRPPTQNHRPIDLLQDHDDGFIPGPRFDHHVLLLRTPEL
jgi:hypothetical protein